MPKGEHAAACTVSAVGQSARALKMTTRATRTSGKDIPEVTDDDGTHVRVIVGDFWGKKAPSMASPPSRAIHIAVPPGEAEDVPGRSVAHAFRLHLRGRGLVP